MTFFRFPVNMQQQKKKEEKKMRKRINKLRKITIPLKNEQGHDLFQCYSKCGAVMRKNSHILRGAVHK